MTEMTVRTYWNQYPFRSDRSVILPYSEAESDRIRREHIQQLFELLVNAGIDESNPKPVKQADVQIALHLYAHNIRFERRLVFDRADGTPMLLKPQSGTTAYQGVELSWTQYAQLIDGLIKLESAPYVQCALAITLYHERSLSELKHISDSTWKDKVTPKRDKVAVATAMVDDVFHSATLDDLRKLGAVFAVYQGQAYPISWPRDCVVDLWLPNGKRKRVDVCDLDDIRQRKFYIDVKHQRFQVELGGSVSVIIPYESGKDYSSLGFKWLDPRGMGPGWEVSMSMIEAVTYRDESVYANILERFQ